MPEIILEPWNLRLRTGPSVALRRPSPGSMTIFAPDAIQIPSPRPSRGPWMWNVGGECLNAGYGLEGVKCNQKLLGHRLVGCATCRMPTMGFLTLDPFEARSQEEPSYIQEKHRI